MKTDGSQPSVSIIIPAYNRADLLPEAIDSVLAQPVTGLEVIVVDDGSTDDTPAVAARYDVQIKYVRQANAGVAAARNRGVAETTGKYVQFLDADDYLLPGGLARLADELDRRADVDVVYSDGYVVDSTGRRLCRLSAYRRSSDPSLDGFVFGQITGLHTALVKRAVLDAIEGPFDPQMIGYEDMDMFMRLAASGARFVYLDVPTCAYRFHGGNKSLPNSPYAERRRQSLLRTRFKVLDGDWYDRLRPETHRRLFHDILTGPAVMDREAIARVLGHARFAALVRTEQASLLYELATERMARESGWLADARYLAQGIRLNPGDPRLFAMVVLDTLPVPWRRALIARWRRWRSGPPAEDPIMAALRRGATPS